MSGQEQKLTWGQVSDGPVGLAALELWLLYLVVLIHTRGMVMMGKLVVLCVAGILAAGMGASASGRTIFADPAAAGGGDGGRNAPLRSAGEALENVLGTRRDPDLALREREKIIAALLRLAK